MCQTSKCNTLSKIYLCMYLSNSCVHLVTLEIKVVHPDTDNEHDSKFLQYCLI